MLWAKKEQGLRCFGVHAELQQVFSTKFAAGLFHEVVQAVRSKSMAVPIRHKVAKAHCMQTAEDRSHEEGHEGEPNEGQGYEGNQSHEGQGE